MAKVDFKKARQKTRNKRKTDLASSSSGKEKRAVRKEARKDLRQIRKDKVKSGEGSKVGNLLRGYVGAYTYGLAGNSKGGRDQRKENLVAEESSFDKEQQDIILNENNKYNPNVV